MTEVEHHRRGADPRRFERMSEADLAGAMSMGDDDPYAWIEFRKRYALDIFSFIKFRGGNAIDDDDAKDCLRVVEERILNSIHRFIPRREGSLKSWCVKIANHVVIDFVESVERRPERLFATPEEIEEHLDERAWGTTDSEGEAEPWLRARTPREEEVHQAFARLTAAEQLVINLSVNTDWPDATIAPLIGRPPNHVRQFRARAIEKLRKLLGREPVKKRKR